MYGLEKNGIYFELEKDINQDSFVITSVTDIPHKYHNNETLIFPDNYNGSPITEIIYPVILPSYIKNIIIPDSFCKIPIAAFSDNYDIEEIQFSKSIKTIPDKCFANCVKLNKITNIEQIESIGTLAFSSTNISFLDLSKTCVNNIDKSAFYNSKLETIIWPDNCFSIPEMCFCKCKKLKSIQNIKNVIKIRFQAFERSSITNLDLSKSKIITIDNYAFSYCENLKTIIWPRQCSIISSNCFSYSSLEEIKNINNVSFIKDGAFRGTNLTTIDLSKSDIISIGKEAFALCKKLKSVIWPNDCNIINNGVFAHCTSLNKLENVECIHTISCYSFKDTGFEKIDFPKDLPNLVEIREDALSDCENLIDVVWPEKATTIYEGTFSNSTNLRNVSGVKNVTIIEKNAFKGITNLNVDFSQSYIVYLDKDSFFNCLNTENIKLPYYI